MNASYQWLRALVPFELSPTELRDLLTRKKSKAQVLAKIEDQAAVESIEDIIKTADLVMVAGRFGFRH